MTEMQALSPEKGDKFIMVVNDDFSKRAWGIAIKNKSRQELLELFQKIIMDAHLRKAAI